MDTLYDWPVSLFPVCTPLDVCWTGRRNHPLLIVISIMQVPKEEIHSAYHHVRVLSIIGVCGGFPAVSSNSNSNCQKCVCVAMLSTLLCGCVLCTSIWEDMEEGVVRTFPPSKCLPPLLDLRKHHDGETQTRCTHGTQLASPWIAKTFLHHTHIYFWWRLCQWAVGTAVGLIDGPW